MEPDTEALPSPPRLLRRCPHHRMVAGVAAGVAEYLDVDVTVVRVAIALLTLCAGVGAPLYAAAWLLVPEEGSDTPLAEQFFGRGGAPA